MSKLNVFPSSKYLDFSNPQKNSNSSNKNTEWVHKWDYKTHFLNKQNNLKLYKQSKYDFELTINVGKTKAGRMLLYWAASSSNSPILKTVDKAYDKFQNHGVSKIDKNGNVKIYINCPQNYKAMPLNKKVYHSYYRHVHFVYSNKENTKWLSQIYTKLLLCNYDFHHTMKSINSGLSVIIDSLPCNSYAMDHIPNSFNLNANEVKKATYKDLEKWFSFVINHNYPKLDSLIKSKKLKINEIPIITYSSNSKCMLSQQTAQELMRKGFINVVEYGGGMADFYKQMRKN